MNPSPASETLTCDVAVIGGGPAGSTVSTLLARQGFDVVMFEKSQHPRFHIGESLLPGNVELFDRLGVREKVERMGMPKYGIEFVSPDHDHCSYLEFAEAWNKNLAFSWQVRRSELDEMLFRHAATQGVRTFESTRVRQLDVDADGAALQAESADGRRQSWRARFVVDASGRDTFLASKLGAKQKNPAHNSSALFGHFRNARRLDGRREGNISIFWFAHGWFWFIPLADGTTSVGAVCWPYYLKSRAKPLKDFFADTIALAPKLAERLDNATLVDDAVHATGNYSYQSTHATGDRYVILGDAFAFVDPMFSSGVYLAMHSGFDGAELVATCLREPARAARARERFEKNMRHGPREYSWFIFRITHPTIREFFMYPRNPVRMKEALLSLLAGDIYGKSPIWASLLAMKAVYYLVSLRHFRRTFAAWRRRRFNIRDVGPVRGENILEQNP